jgi:NAD(P)-dependent dehydrogenase (short-subunit alcohol dehydrogenase family)
VATRFLNGQVCLVTGGAQGIGWAIAQALADHGALVFVCDVSQPNLARAAEELKQHPWSNRIRLATCDVTQRDALEAWIADTYRQTGRIDVLVNNAAYAHFGDLVELPVEDVLRTMRVGFDAMVYAVHSVLPLMQKAGRGHIVNMGSVAGRLLMVGSMAPYAAAKAAIDAYTQVLQMELRRSPVQVTLVRPSVVAGTDFFRQQVAASVMPRLVNIVPYTTPPQVARAVVRALRRKRRIVDIPFYLPLYYLLFQLAPGLSRWLAAISGRNAVKYGEVPWQYESIQNKP